MEESQFSQALISRQEEIDNLLIDYVQVGGPKEWAREKAIDKGIETLENVNLIISTLPFDDFKQLKDELTHLKRLDINDYKSHCPSTQNFPAIKTDKFPYAIL